MAEMPSIVDTSPTFETTDDAFLAGALSILQPKRGPRTAIDAIFLAAAVNVCEDKKHDVLEAGSGSGVVGLALAHRAKNVNVIGVEIESELARLAQQNAERNDLADRAKFFVGDVTGTCERFTELGLAAESFHHVIANPPFLTKGAARKAGDRLTCQAHVTDVGALEKWVRFLTRMAAPKGVLTLIHRADALTELLSYLDKRFGALVISPLFPKQGEPAKRIIVQGIKGSRAPLTLNRGLILHDKKGNYTPEAEAILRGVKPLIL